MNNEAIGFLICRDLTDYLRRWATLCLDCKTSTQSNTLHAPDDQEFQMIIRKSDRQIIMKWSKTHCSTYYFAHEKVMRPPDKYEDFCKSVHDYVDTLMMLLDNAVYANLSNVMSSLSSMEIVISVKNPSILVGLKSSMHMDFGDSMWSLKTPLLQATVPFPKMHSNYFGRPGSPPLSPPLSPIIDQVNNPCPDHIQTLNGTNDDAPRTTSPFIPDVSLMPDASRGVSLLAPDTKTPSSLESAQDPKEIGEPEPEDDGNDGDDEEPEDDGNDGDDEEPEDDGDDGEDEEPEPEPDLEDDGDDGEDEEPEDNEHDEHDGEDEEQENEFLRMLLDNNATKWINSVKRRQLTNISPLNSPKFKRFKS